MAIPGIDIKRPKENLVIRFSVISFVAMAIIALVLGYIFYNDIRAQAIEHLTADAVLHSDHVAGVLSPADFNLPMTGERYQRFDEFVQEAIVSRETARVKIWSRDGVIIYSDEPMVVGMKFLDNELLTAALSGETVIEIQVPEAAENEHERTLGTLMEVYTPIFFPGSDQPQGVLEIYQYYAPTAQLIAKAQREILLAIILGFLLLYGSLVSIVWRSSKTIKEQYTTIVSSNEKLSELNTELNASHENLESRVQKRTQQLSEANRQLEEEFAEHERAEEELKFRAELLGTVNDAIIVYDFDGNIIYANENACISRGYSRDEFIKQNLHSLVKSDAGFIDSFLMELKEKGEASFESVNIRKDKSEFPAEIRARVIQMGQERNILSIEHDITERKNMEREREEILQQSIMSSRLASVGEMAAGIAHEINNPLTGIIGYSDLLMETDLPEDIRKDIEIISEGGRRVASIVKRMLTFARQSKPMKEPVNINTVIETTLEIRDYSMKLSNIKVTKQLDEQLPETIADAGQLQQVFLNIILNAEKAMSETDGIGKLTITTEKVNNDIRISFSDNGPGILPENIERIFDPFFTTREVGQGTGLGLSICHGIITEHNGRIYAKSTMGKGATFIIELPIVNGAEQTELSEPEVEGNHDVPPVRILVVDDEPLVQRLLLEVLGKQGHEVEIVDNGDKAIERLDNGEYDIIFLDIKMPGTSGIDIYKQLQKTSESLIKKIIFITGDVMGKDTRSFFETSDAPYITKPFSVTDLNKGMAGILAANS